MMTMTDSTSSTTTGIVTKTGTEAPKFDGDIDTEIKIVGVDTSALAKALDVGTDHGGNPIEPFIDEAGGWPLRCCLQNSRPGDHIAIIAWSPFSWTGPYAEVGPIVVHTEDCPGPAAAEAGLPAVLAGRAMTLRPYGNDRRIAYDKVRHVDEKTSLTEHLQQLLNDPEVMEVHGRNVTGGCYAFQAFRDDGDAG